MLGATGVGLAALGAHALKGILSTDALVSFETATRIQLLHAVLLVAMAAFAERHPSPPLRWALACVLVGVFLFSGSIYILTLLQMKFLPIVLATPVGGTALIAGWLLFGWAAFRYYRSPG
jgi:uncharacterized membrane protein YgdD (TMEM256/DUF423 family)